jgi:putative protein-disulfide isomerase
MTDLPLLEITYYTDPLCSWCWGFEGVWRRLRYELADRIAWRYVLGGLLPDWQNFNDPLRSVSRPAQVGPLWYEVRHLTGMPLDERIWIADPPTSSYPACVAVKAAGLQGAELAEAYLRRLREAVMTERRNIARREILIDLFAGLAAALLPAAVRPDLYPDYPDIDRFRRDLGGEEAQQAFREDLKDAGYRGIGRFPAFVLRRAGSPAVALVGYRPYSVFREALAAVAPELQPVRTADDPLAYALSWGSITAAEVAEALARPVDEITRELDTAVEAGGLVRAGQTYRHPATVAVPR